MTYAERRLAPTVVLWRGDAGPGGTAILPDGCLDLVWDGTRLAVAGPDTHARHHDGAGRFVGLRLSHGSGPLALGVAAHALRDRTVDLAAVWGDGRARALTDRVADDPVRALAAWALPTPVDPLGRAVAAALADGAGVATLAAELGLAERTLHRRCRGVFGYGPQHLARVLRLQGALARARAGRSWAAVAAELGYSDQPHLVREFRALTGATPTALRGRPRYGADGAKRSTGTPSGSRTTA